MYYETNSWSAIFHLFIYFYINTLRRVPLMRICLIMMMPDRQLFWDRTDLISDIRSTCNGLLIWCMHFMNCWFEDQILDCYCKQMNYALPPSIDLGKTCRWILVKVYPVLWTPIKYQNAGSSLILSYGQTIPRGRYDLKSNNE